MKLSLKTIVAAGALALASTSALAQVAVPPQPAPGPFLNGGDSNGGLLLSVWDEVRGVSIVQYLGLRLNDIRPDADMTTPGTELDFGTISGFSSVFAGSDAANIRYHLIAADAQGVGTNSKAIAVTFSAEADSYAVNNLVVSNVALAYQQFTNNWLNGTGGCAGTNPCSADSSLDGQYAGAMYWGSNINGILPQSASASIGSALHFALASSGATPAAQAAISLYYDAATSTFGQWLLDTNGNLTYSVSAVPLPAAVWMFLSGIAGLGAVARRRRAAA